MAYHLWVPCCQSVPPCSMKPQTSSYQISFDHNFGKPDLTQCGMNERNGCYSSSNNPNSVSHQIRTIQISIATQGFKYFSNLLQLGKDGSIVDRDLEIQENPRLIRHRLIRQFAYLVTFSSVPAEFLSFVYISVRVIRHRLIHQFAQFVISFYPLEAFCSVNSSFAVSLLMSKQLVVPVGLQTN